MSSPAQARRMKKALRAGEVEALLREIRRYLAYVDALRTVRPPRDDPKRERAGKDD